MPRRVHREKDQGSMAKTNMDFLEKEWCDVWETHFYRLHDEDVSAWEDEIEELCAWGPKGAEISRAVRDLAEDVIKGKQSEKGVKIRHLIRKLRQNRHAERDKDRHLIHKKRTEKVVTTLKSAIKNISEEDVDKANLLRWNIICDGIESCVIDSAEISAELEHWVDMNYTDYRRPKLGTVKPHINKAPKRHLNERHKTNDEVPACKRGWTWRSCQCEDCSYKRHLHEAELEKKRELEAKKLENQ